MSLPVGTVTFFFTDIEGSTRLWEQYPEAMSSALARHDALLREAIARHQGSVFKTVGDAFCAAFDTPSDALAAALTAQKALGSESWPAETPLRVRVALHTGVAEVRDGDYFGPALNRVARLLAVGHGGQTLLSSAAQELTRDTLPSGAALQDLGAHRLKDLTRPERIFQLLHPALPSAFPPLRSLSNPDLPNNLPLQTTSFIGRETTMAEVKNLLHGTRLLTLTGSGGCGKTRLSLQIAADILDQYPDGVWFVELASLNDPALVPRVLASVLDVREEAGHSLTQSLCNSLKTKQLLLLLDNCEHVLNACAQLSDALLRACPNLRILATSREPLNIAGEQTYRIPSLSLPDPKQEQTPESLSQYEAVRLFIERALQSRSDFAVTNANAPAVASICARLDGIPLALELAAARIRSLSVAEIQTRLDSVFRLLTGGSRTALPRQQTLRALIDWSYNLLTESEQMLFRRLSVFAGGWTLGAAERITAGDGLEDGEILDLLTALCDRSLVIATEHGAITRYRLLETVRQYATERLAESGEAATMGLRHRDYYTLFTENAEERFRGPEAAEWLAQFETEQDNLRAAIVGSMTAPDRTVALRLITAFSWFCNTRGYLGEGWELLSPVVFRVLPDPSALERLDALRAAGWLAHLLNYTEEADRIYTELAHQARKRNDTYYLATALNGLGLIAMLHHGDFSAAQHLLEQSLELNRLLPGGGRSHIVLNNLCLVAQRSGDYMAAEAYSREALELARQREDWQAIAVTLSYFGSALYEQMRFDDAADSFAQAQVINRKYGFHQRCLETLTTQGDLSVDRADLTAARQFYNESLDLSRELQYPAKIRNSLAGLAFVAAAGEIETAPSLLLSALEMAQAADDYRNIAMSLQGVAVLASSRGQHEQAARLLGAEQAQRRAYPVAISPYTLLRWQRLEQPSRIALGEEVFDTIHAAGATMTQEQAIQLAQEILSSPGQGQNP